MSQIEFKAPGPGSWELEQTHFGKPATRYASTLVSDPIAKGFGEGTKRYGLLLDTLRFGFVNDFCYVKFVAVGAPDNASGPPPRPIFMLLTRLHPEIRRRIATAPDVFSKKIWREDLRRWDEEIKPDSIARNRKIQDTPLATLGDAAFVAYLDAVRANAAEMIYRHHMFTIPSSFPVGHFVSEVQRWTGLPSGEVLGALKGAAPISRGVGAGPIERLRAALAASGITRDSVRGRPAQQVLEDLKSKPGVGEALQVYLDEVAYRLVSGYDIGDKYALEMPEMLVGAIFGSTDKADRQGDFTKRRDALRAKVPEAHRAEFDELLEEARFVYRLRDERGMYNDSWAFGLARRAMLEAGRRLVVSGVLPDAALAIDASHEEIIGMLEGGKGPGVEELRRRQTWRETKTIADAPPFLGAALKGPPPPEWLPRKAQANARAVDTVLREVFNVPVQQAPPRSVSGLPVHPGIYEGPARVIAGPEDFNRLQKGDVLVTRTTGPAFNVVLPLLGAIVTDRGGQLSHAAIVAREYGIPAVVGTREATTMFADGARVRVNGDTGAVDLVEAGR
ncbi:MAG TPA: PEP-utilizing enzyme [Vicinamibacterales bacterium]|nr:PEP-utilizing enzyme [Vicinamibacterales bacterium]